MKRKGAFGRETQRGGVAIDVCACVGVLCSVRSCGVQEAELPTHTSVSRESAEPREEDQEKGRLLLFTDTH